MTDEMIVWTLLLILVLSTSVGRLYSGRCINHVPLFSWSMSLTTCFRREYSLNYLSWRVDSVSSFRGFEPRWRVLGGAVSCAAS